jgi:hypothetical protein
VSHDGHSVMTKIIEGGCDGSLAETLLDHYCF